MTFLEVFIPILTLFSINNCENFSKGLSEVAMSEGFSNDVYDSYLNCDKHCKFISQTRLTMLMSI